MKILLYSDPGDEMPMHELEARISHDYEECVLHYAPTDQYFTYFDTDGETYVSFRLTQVVTVNVALSGG